MEIVVDRAWKRNTYVISRFLIDGNRICEALEDRDRGLNQNMDSKTIKAIKVQNETAIPSGRYRVTMDVVSPKFSKYPFYMEVCGGKLPRLLDVPGFDGILIHVSDGPKAEDLLSGCIGVGENKIVGQLTNGKETFRKVYKLLKKAHDRGEEIWITVG